MSTNNLAKKRKKYVTGGLQPETKGSPRRGKQNIEKKNTENKIEKNNINRTD